jgi:hypothetical protein
MLHGQRLTPQHKIVESLQKPAQKSLEWLKQILANNQPLDKKDVFHLNQILTAAERLAIKNEAEREKLRQKLEEAEDEGEKLGFSVEKIRGMNATAFLIDNEGWLQEFIKQAKKKVGGNNGRSQ